MQRLQKHAPGARLRCWIRRPVPHERKQRAPRHRRRPREPSRIAKRGRDVHQENRIRDGAPGRFAPRRRPASDCTRRRRIEARRRRRNDDQRDVKRALVEENSVSFLSVLAERFPVVRSKNDPPRAAAPRDPRKQAGHGRVGCRSLGVVGIAKRLGERRGRLVRIVGLVEMHPEKHRSCRSLPQPCEGAADRFLSGPLRWTIPLPTRRTRHPVVVEIEAPRKAEFVRERVAGHEGSRRPSPLLQHLRDDRDTYGQSRADVVPNAVPFRAQPGENRRVRRERQRRLRVGLGEDDAAARQRRHRRHRAAWKGPVVPQRVHRDEQDRGRGLGCGARERESRETRDACGENSQRLSPSRWRRASRGPRRRPWPPATVRDMS